MVNSISLTFSQGGETSGLIRGVTPKQLRGWFWAWFLAQRERYPEDSDRAFARRTGLTPTEVGHFVAGDRMPSWAAIVKVANAIPVKADDLFLDLAGRARATLNAAVVADAEKAETTRLKALAEKLRQEEARKRGEGRDRPSKQPPTAPRPR